MTGIDLLEEIRKDDDLRKLPFIIVTAETKTENVVKAKNAGVNKYIVKPFEIGVLKSKITSVLGDF